MEDYLHFMKTLRFQMNDVEDQAAKLSMEEQMQLTIIQTFQNDIGSAKSAINKLREDTEQLLKRKGQICAQILEKQRNIASLESDSSTLAQSLELIQQEKIALSAKLVERRTFYQKTKEEINCRLQEQKDWSVSLDTSKQGTRPQKENDTRKVLLLELDAAKTKLNEISNEKSKLVLENKKMKLAIGEIHSRAKDFEPVLMAMDIKALEEEYNSISSERAGLMEYLQSLQDQVEKLKGISQVVKCVCGEEYVIGTSIGS